MTTRTDARSPEQAEAAFYTAFENGDLEAMARIWARSDDIVCVHPHGPQLVGYDQIIQSWQNILDSTAGFRIAVELVNQFHDGDMAVRFVNETLINENSEATPVTVLATNAYRRTESGWRIILHHASPPPQAVEATTEQHADTPDSGVTLH